MQQYELNTMQAMFCLSTPKQNSWTQKTFARLGVPTKIFKATIPWQICKTPNGNTRLLQRCSRFKLEFIRVCTLYYCACHAKSSSCTESKNENNFTKRGFGAFQNIAQSHQTFHVPRQMTSKTTSHFDPHLPNVWATCTKYHACHADEKVSKVLRLSRKDAVPDFQTSKRPEQFTPAAKNAHSSQNTHRAPVKLDLQKKAKQNMHFARACAVEMHMDISQTIFLRELMQSRAASQNANPEGKPGFYPYGKTPSVWTHSFGEKKMVAGSKWWKTSRKQKMNDEGAERSRTEGKFKSWFPNVQAISWCTDK